MNMDSNLSLMYVTSYQEQSDNKRNKVGDYYKAVIRSAYIDRNKRHQTAEIYCVGDQYRKYIGDDTPNEDTLKGYYDGLTDAHCDPDNNAIMGIKFDIRLSGSDFCHTSDDERIGLCNKTVNAFVGKLQSQYGLVFDLAVIRIYKTCASIQIIAHDENLARTAQQYADMYNDTCMSVYFGMYGN